MEQISRIGMDTSKRFFQLHGVNTAETVVLRKKLRRKEMVTFFEKLAPTVVGIEACGASHQPARVTTPSLTLPAVEWSLGGQSDPGCELAPRSE